MLLTIYHNLNWSKSRQSLALLENENIEFNIVEYIKKPPSLEDLKSLSKKLNHDPQEFMRKNDSRYKELNLSEFSGSNDELLQIIHENPRILERPIIVYGDKAVIGRPPENIFKLLKK